MGIGGWSMRDEWDWMDYWGRLDGVGELVRVVGYGRGWVEVFGEWVRVDGGRRNDC